MSLSCVWATRFALYLLRKYAAGKNAGGPGAGGPGVVARQVNLWRLPPWSGGDTGHSTLELWGVLDGGAPTWALVDLDLNVVPRQGDDGRALSLLELYTRHRPASRGRGAPPRRPLALQQLAVELLPGVLLGDDGRSLSDARTGEAIDARRYRRHMRNHTLLRKGDAPLPSPVGSVVNETASLKAFASESYAKYLGAIAVGNMIVRDGRLANNDPSGGSVLLCSDPCSQADATFFLSRARAEGGPRLNRSHELLNASSFRKARYSTTPLCSWTCPPGSQKPGTCCKECIVAEPGYRCKNGNS